MTETEHDRLLRETHEILSRLAPLIPKLEELAAMWESNPALRFRFKTRRRDAVPQDSPG